jgi:RHS repeat-associated protein
LSHVGAADSAIGYTGNWTDPDTGLVYLRARDYDPATAQFMTIDPVVDVTRQPYTYVSNNPLVDTDPTGLCPVAYFICQRPANAAKTAYDYLRQHTVGFCGNGSAAVGVSISANACIASAGGHHVLLVTAGDGNGGPLFVGGSGGVLVSNATSPDPLTGKFYDFNGFVGKEGPSLGEEFAWGHDKCGRFIWTNQIAGGFGISLTPAGATFGPSYTWAIPLP